MSPIEVGPDNLLEGYCILLPLLTLDSLVWSRLCGNSLLDI